MFAVYADTVRHTPGRPEQGTAAAYQGLWLLPKAMNTVIESVLFNLPPSPYEDEETFTKALDYWFGKVMK